MRLDQVNLERFGMISVEQAKKLIEKNIPSLKKGIKPLTDVLGSVLAEDIHAKFDLPLYDNSAMDGFVLRSGDTRGASPYEPVSIQIQGVVRAGDPRAIQVGPFEAYRIMTGAPIPRGGDTVLPKEDAVVHGHVLILSQKLSQGRHIRCQGEEIKKGALILEKGSFIHAGTVGMLASLGKKEVKVFSQPKVYLVSTGSELTQPGKPLRRGQIYDSNSWMVASSLEEMGLCALRVKTVKDEPKVIRKVLSEALLRSDVVILTGGVSVGEYDYVKEILEDLGVRPVFWKVSQKPGKPLFFGKRRRTLVFGLPGNPASVYICFYEYIYPALRRMCGMANPDLELARLPLSQDQEPDRSKFLFLKGRRVSRNGNVFVQPFHHQGSHMISTLQDMDAIIRIPPGGGILRKGDKVDVEILRDREGMG